MKRAGVCVHAELERHGFYPAGGGRIRLNIKPTEKFQPPAIKERGEIKRRLARAVVANLDRNIAARELETVRGKLELKDEELQLETVKDSVSPGNYVAIEIESAELFEVFTGFGARGVLAEAVASQAADEARAYLSTGGAAVGEHLADQLLIPLALAGAGSFTTLPLSLHSRTNIEVIKKFLDVDFNVTPINERTFRVEARS